MGTKIDYKTTSSKTAAFQKARDIITPEYIEKFQVKADVICDERAYKMIAKGSGFTLELKFFDQYCEVDIDLSFLLKPLKGKILEKVENQIKKNL